MTVMAIHPVNKPWDAVFADPTRKHDCRRGCGMGVSALRSVWTVIKKGLLQSITTGPPTTMSGLT
jgi:hypothetical protein